MPAPFVTVFLHCLLTSALTLHQVHLILILLFFLVLLLSPNIHFRKCYSAHYEYSSWQHREGHWSVMDSPFISTLMTAQAHFYSYTVHNYD